MRLLGIILLLLSGYFSFGQTNPDSLKRMEDEVLAVNRAMEAEFNQGHYAKIGEFYADSAVMVGNKVEVIGKNNLIAYWGKFENAHAWKLENIEVTALGSDFALQRGFSNISFYNANELQTARSIFSLVWIRTDEGWKILLDHFSPR